jgi:hypothetical protein
MSRENYIGKSVIANRLQVHPTSVNRIFARDGGPKPVKIGCRERYKESEFESYLKQKGLE